MIYMDCVKYGKGLLLASLIPAMLMLLSICALPPSTKCWAFQLAVAMGGLLVAMTRLRWLRALVITSFVLKFALVESFDEQVGNMPVVSLIFTFILL